MPGYGTSDEIQELLEENENLKAKIEELEDDNRINRETIKILQYNIRHLQQELGGYLSKETS
jgi:chaperonin cofactor prefoldin